MENNINISIGIPAYNESGNIKKLLSSLLLQTEKGFSIKEIIVVSDGSTDGTVDRVRSLHDGKIKLIAERQRLGKSARIDQILKIFQGDVLLLLDGDVIISDKLLISNIIKQSDFNKSGLVGINAKPYRANTVFQKIMEAGVLVSQEIGKNWKNRDNYLSFKGCFLGLSKSFAKSVKMPKETINNDSFLYFAAKENNFSPVFLEDEIIYFKSPLNFSDYLKQSSRFKTSKKELQKYFKFDLDPEYKIPNSVYFFSFVKCFFSNPFFLTAYLLTNIATRLRNEKEIKSTWNIAVSTKK